MNPLTTYIEDPSTGEPPPRPAYDISKIDQAKVWMIYAAFGGDIEKTAISSKTPAAVVKALEHDFNWPVKLKRLKTGAGESEAERVANRAVSYLQAQRMREVIEKSLQLLEDEDALVRALVKLKFLPNGDVIGGVEVSPKAILDLAKALESVHSACYRALGDKIPAQADPVDKDTRGGNSMNTVRDVLGILHDMSKATSKPVPTVPAIPVHASP